MKSEPQYPWRTKTQIAINRAERALEIATEKVNRYPDKETEEDRWRLRHAIAWIKDAEKQFVTIEELSKKYD